MKSKFILFVLLIVAIVVLACLMGPLIFNSYQNQKQESQLNITSNITQYREDNFTVRLSDMNGNPISNEQIHIVMLNESKSFEYTAVTDSNGVASLNLEDKEFGKYTFNCTFNGNGQFKPTNTIQRIDLVQRVITAPDYVEVNATLNSSYAGNDSYSEYIDTGSYENVSQGSFNYISV
jgi:hypothetical protein